MYPLVGGTVRDRKHYGWTDLIMSDQKLKELLGSLQKTLENTDKVDSETLQLVRELDEDINRLLDPESPEDDQDSVIERAQEVETQFAIKHPTAERFLREIIDALSKVGI
jgi:hypothetical protein